MVVEPMPEKGSRITVWSGRVNDSMRRETSWAGNIAGCLRAVSSDVLEMSLQMLMEFFNHLFPSRSFALCDGSFRGFRFISGINRPCSPMSSMKLILASDWL